MILDKIVAHKKNELVYRKEKYPLSDLKTTGQANTAPRGFGEVLKASSQTALIAEIKRASPSAGWIRKDVDLVELAKTYDRCGASAISVLTDEEFFKGSISGLREVKQAIGIPVLRKDFIVDPYQIYEALAFGADAILLIVAILSDNELKRFLSLCEDFTLDALVEVHTKEELDKAIEAGAKIIGINNRDLKTFDVNLSTTIELVRHIPKDVICVSESGIKTYDDIRCVKEAGVDAVLVGTVLMEAEDTGEKIRELVGIRND